jgi:dTDP-4-dehydrorhamnose reductase
VKTIVLGAAGQLGRDLCPRLPGVVLPLTRADVDLTDAAALRELLTEVRPDAVVNCAAYNFVDRAESEPEAAFAVNTWAVRELARICRDLDCVLVQFSTDYVFGLDENRRIPWRESDAPGPVSVYGLSKLAGEHLVRSLCPRHLVLRTCGLYGIRGSGGKGGNFVETMLRLGGQGKPLRVVDDQVCTPSYTVDVATAVAALLETKRYGLFHLTSAGSCSWYLTPIRSAEYNAAALRPSFSVLDNASLLAAGVPPGRRWREALAAYLEERAREGRSELALLGAVATICSPNARRRRSVDG